METTFVSNQWLAAYYKALAKSWEHPEFKEKLLSAPAATLKKHCEFVAPGKIEIHFEEVNNNDFSTFPEFSVAIFDTPPLERTVLKIPLVPRPDNIITELAHLNSFTAQHNMYCCCMCC